MEAIIAGNDWVYLNNLTSEVELAIISRLSAKHPRARYINDAAQQSWDGWYRKYQKGNQRIARPLLFEIEDVCKRLGVPLEIIDHRPPDL